jgi:hypothetical protein
VGRVVWQFTWVVLFIYGLNTGWGIIGRHLSLRDALLQRTGWMALNIGVLSVGMMFFRRWYRRQTGYRWPPRSTSSSTAESWLARTAKRRRG